MAVLLMDYLAQMSLEFQTAMESPRKGYQEKGVTINATDEELKVFLSWAADSADYLSKLVSGEYTFPNSTTDLDNEVWCKTLTFIHDGVDNIRVGKAILSGEPFRSLDMNGTEKTYGYGSSNRTVVGAPAFAKASTKKADDEAKAKAKAAEAEKKVKAEDKAVDDFFAMLEDEAKAEEAEKKAKASEAEKKAKAAEAEAKTAEAEKKAKAAEAEAKARAENLSATLDAMFEADFGHEARNKKESRFFQRLADLFAELKNEEDNDN